MDNLVGIRFGHHSKRLPSDQSLHSVALKHAVTWPNQKHRTARAWSRAIPPANLQSCGHIYGIVGRYANGHIGA